MSVISLWNPLSFRRDGRVKLYQSGGKVGGAAGFTLNAANNIGRLATVAASQTAAKLVMPLHGLHQGDVVTGFFAIGQIESAGNAVTWDLELRKLTAAAADIVDASVASATQLSVTADTVMSRANTYKAVAEDSRVPLAAYETLYLIATVTTLGSTDVDLMALAVEYSGR